MSTGKRAIPRRGGASPEEAAEEFLRRAQILEALASPENAGAVAYREAAAFLSPHSRTGSAELADQIVARVEAGKRT